MLPQPQSPLALTNPQHTVDELVEFIAHTFMTQGKQKAVIAVSGGIDSALSLTLATRALGAQHITTLFLPYADQSLEDSQAIVDFNHIPSNQQITQPIDWMVEIICSQLHIPLTETMRVGNIMARCRMIAVYDWAKKRDALVIGTENKSEHYLGYFTRFGDAAADVEPISTLYKTQVRQLAEFLKIPQGIIDKAPSAGLWADQTDEQELGFSYDQADRVLSKLEKIHFEVRNSKQVSRLEIENVPATIIKKVIDRVKNMEFKRTVPFELKNKESHS